MKVTKASIDWKALGERRASVSDTLSGGVKMLWDKNKITQIEGEGSLTDDGNVAVGGETYETKNVVLATGSVAMAIPGVEFSERIVDTWGAWSLPAQPKKLAIVGAGASGSEIASAYARYGTEVTLIEMLGQILPARGQGLRPGRRADLQEAGHHGRDRRADRERRGDREVGQVHLRREPGRGGLPRHRRRPRARHRSAQPRGRRRRDRGRTASSRSTSSSAPRTRRSSRSATSCAVPRLPTRPPRRASSPSRRSPARPPTPSTST